MFLLSLLFGLFKIVVGIVLVALVLLGCAILATILYMIMYYSTYQVIRFFPKKKELLADRMRATMESDRKYLAIWINRQDLVRLATKSYDDEFVSIFILGHNDYWIPRVTEFRSENNYDFFSRSGSAYKLNLDKEVERISYDFERKEQRKIAVQREIAERKEEKLKHQASADRLFMKKKQEVFEKR